jgi:phenylacetate-CoA ligase
MMTNWRRPLLSLALRAFHPVTARELAFLRRLDRAPAAELRRVHEERLTALLRHAYAQTDYYREVLGDLGVVRGDGREVDLGSFGLIPILTKDIIRAQSPRLRAKELPDGREAYVNRTGGSTGQPVEYWQDDHYWDVNVATKLYHFEMLGKRLGEPELKIWGSDRDLVLETGTALRRAQNYGYNRRIVTCGALRPEDIDALVAEVNRFRPKSVWGYIDALYTIAEYVNRTGAELHGPAAVFGGGGTMFPQMRESIRRAFGAPVINFYGSREMGDVASECAEMDGLHVSSTSHKVEVVDASGRPVTARTATWSSPRCTTTRCPSSATASATAAASHPAPAPAAAASPSWRA